LPTRTMSPASLRMPDEGWAILADPPGVRDLLDLEYWTASQERSIALSAVALGGPAAGIAGAQGTAVAKSAPSMQLARGASGPQVRALQRALGIPADGHFGRQTERAVRAFQRAHGIPATGFVGPLTTAALKLQPGAPSNAAAGPQTPATTTPASLTSDLTRAMQRALGVSADGVIGPLTRAAIRTFQAAHGLPATGQPDAATLQALGVGSTSTTSNTPSVAPSTTTTPPPATTTGASSPAQAAVAAAMTRVGSPYRSGGTGPSSFDCSGLVVWAMAKAGVSMPRTSFAQYGTGTAVPSSAIQAGDLVFFDTAGAGASDVGIATGPDTAVSATTHGVMTHSIHSGYWGSHYVGARRVA